MIGIDTQQLEHPGGRVTRVAAPTAPPPPQGDFDEIDARSDAGPRIYRDPGASEPLRARLRFSADGQELLVTTEPLLRDGDLLYVEGRGAHQPHRVTGLRPGLRARDSRDLRVGLLIEVEH